MAKISRALALLLTFASSQAQFSPPGETAFRKYTLDDIVPATDQASGHIKCCPAGTEFDGRGCVINVPICPQGSTRDGDKCIAHTKPSCDTGYDYQNGFCITNKPPTCDHGTILKGNHCVLEGVANCEARYTLQGNVCVAQKPPVCPDGEFFNGKSCTSLKGPKCRDGAKLENGLCIDNSPPACPKGTSFDNVSSRCISEQVPRCPENTVLQNKQCVSTTGLICGDGGIFNPKTQSCVIYGKPQCPAGTELNDKKCTYIGQLECQQGTSLSINEAQGTSRCCPFAMAWDGKVCFTKPIDGKCSDGSAPINNRCEKHSNPQPICPQNYKLENTRCISQEPPRCASGSHLEAEKCTFVRKAECP